MSVFDPDAFEIEIEDGTIVFREKNAFGNTVRFARVSAFTARRIGMRMLELADKADLKLTPTSELPRAPLPPHKRL